MVDAGSLLSVAGTLSSVSQVVDSGKQVLNNGKEAVGNLFHGDPAGFCKKGADTLFSAANTAVGIDNLKNGGVPTLAMA